MATILDLPEARERVMRWSVKDYERFTELGVFRKNVELIRGIVLPDAFEFAQHERGFERIRQALHFLVDRRKQIAP